MKTVPKSLCCLSCAILLLMMESNLSYAAGNTPKAGIYTDIRYSVVVNKTQNNRQHKIRLYTEAGQESLLFTVNGVEGKNYQLYVFDMDGKLVTQANIHNRETSVLNNISKGNYLFEVLINDEQVESGQLTVK